MNIRENQNSKSWLQLILLFFLSGFLLLYSVNLNLPFEGDQIAKAAKIIFVSQEKSFFNSLGEIEFYRDHLFSFFYILYSLFYSVFGGNIFASMNLLAVILGAVFLCSISVILAKVYGVGWIYTLLIFLSMPVVVETFSYGNEVACALTFLSLSLAVTTTAFRWRFLVSSALFCLSIFSRADYVFLIPFWLCWIAVYTWRGKNHIEFLRKVAYLIGFLGLFCTLYWVILLRSFTLDLGGHIGQYNFSPKILLAFLSYPFCIAVVLLGLAGNFLLFYEHRSKALVNILLLLPLIYYANILTSPKFIILLCLFYGIPAALFLSRVNIKIKVISFLLIAVCWFLSISPFGIKFSDAQHWVIPASDGSIPTGGYFAFYKSARAGETSDQLQLRELLETGKEVFAYIQKFPGDYLFSFDTFNERLFLYELITESEKGFKNALKDFRYQSWSPELSSKLQNSTNKILLIRKSYLQNSDFVNKFLNSGQVRNPPQDDSILPRFIEIGQSIPVGYNTDLGKRILFVSNYFDGNVPIPSRKSQVFKKSLCWIEHSKTLKSAESPSYSDTNYSLYSSLNNSQCKYLNSDYPVVYYGEKNLQKNLQGKEPLRVNFWEYRAP